MAVLASSCRSTTVTIVFVLTTCGMVGTAGAQDSRAYVGGSAMFSAQQGHRQGIAPSLPTTGAGGLSVGLTAESGIRVAPRVAVGVELSVPRRFTDVQQTNYLRVFQQESHHRDLILSGVVRTTMGSGAIRLGLVGGGGLVQEQTQRRLREADNPFAFPRVFGAYSRPESFSRWTVSALAGAEAEIVISPRVALVQQFRLHFVRRYQDTSQPGWALGLNTLVVRPAFGVRVTL